MPDLPPPCPQNRKPKPTTRLSSARRGYGAAHRKRRADYLARHPLCACGCGQWATELDHIDGNVMNCDEANLQGLTKACHARKTNKEQR